MDAVSIIPDVVWGEFSRWTKNHALLLMGIKLVGWIMRTQFMLTVSIFPRLSRTRMNGESVTRRFLSIWKLHIPRGSRISGSHQARQDQDLLWTKLNYFISPNCVYGRHGKLKSFREHVSGAFRISTKLRVSKFCNFRYWSLTIPVIMLKCAFKLTDGESGITKIHAAGIQFLQSIKMSTDRSARFLMAGLWVIITLPLVDNSAI